MSHSSLERSRSPQAMTLTAFQASAQTVTMAEAERLKLGVYADDDPSIQAVQLYDLNCYILDHGVGYDGGRYSLTLENQGWQSDDLAALEVHLYERWYLSLF